jgi:vacuolar iron transporter family protein
MTRSRNASGRASRAGIGITPQPAPCGVLGANDGIVSVADLVVGVAGATTASGTILTAGAAGLVVARSPWGSASMSVNSQRDSQQAMITEERRELKQHPEDEFDELVRLYVAKPIMSPRQPFAANRVTVLAREERSTTSSHRPTPATPWTTTPAGTLARPDEAAVDIAAE